MEERSDPAAAAMSSNGVNAAAPRLPANRHIVTWKPEEDDLLRQQIAHHGTENWTNIASKFKDKTGRQCRRRWSTYLNSECKKGGWSAEEDMLLCEAQKIFGNRWTEIAKVVSGRTDNAVKNRFSTLCKKRAKLESSSNDCLVNSTNKRLVVQIGCSNALAGESELMNKQIRFHNSDNKENIERLLGKDGEGDSSRQPLAVLVQNFNTASTMLTNTRKSSSGVSENDNQGTYLKRDDPKLAALLQQAELLTSLSAKVNAENTDQSLDDAWKELQDFLVQTEQHQSLEKELSGIDLLVDDIKDLFEGLKRNNAEGQQSLRLSDSHDDSLGSSQRSSGSSYDTEAQRNIFVDKSENSLPIRDTKICVLSDDASSLPVNVCPETTLIPSGTSEVDNENLCTTALAEFSSPLQTVQPFKTFADGIPSPAFTASERQFLNDVLDLSSPSPSPHVSKDPSCKRALLDSL